MSAHRHPAASWLIPSAEIHSSPIAGQGLYATVPIPAGTAVMLLGGTLIDDAALVALTPPYSSLTVEPGRHLLLDPAHPVRYGNHSCDPTLWHIDATTLTARRRLEPGEELTVDYATHTGYESWTMACRCGTPVCRGTVTGSDWRLPGLQRRYAGHWSPPLRDRIRTLAAEDGG
ncbi:SET domain-containing protein [Streptomyces sp. NPDC060022]|uniref:SET domain-containing protein n=1 Tax=Streptomyces sp. NPDC060022 TaxID=3347039 RepID=UPI0036835024